MSPPPGKAYALRIYPAGDRALLLEPVESADMAGLIDALRALDTTTGDVQDLLPAARTVLVTLREGADRSRVEHVLERAFETRSAVRETPAGAVLEIPVRYDGVDMEYVAHVLHCSTADVIALHTGRVWRCAFIGFAPGFGYLTSDDSELAIPRRTQPRTTVPAGAVALAGRYSAVYPRASPGGWQIIGTTDVQMWDLARDVPNLLEPGSRVRFVEIRT